MPIIPIPTKSNALPNAPAPVLDRERRPTVDKSQEIAGVANLAKAGKMPDVPMSLAEPYGALGSVGKAVVQAGGIMSALAIKRQEAESDIQVANADNAMQAERSKFEQWKIETNADPSTWGEEWGKRFGDTQKLILSNDKLHPAAREQIALRLNRYGGQSLSDVEMGATKETFARAKSAFVASIDSATEAQDSARFESALATAAERGYLYAHEIENAKQHFVKVGEQKRKQAEADTERVEYESAVSGAIADPRGWLEQNKEPWKGKEILWQKVKNAADAREREGTSEAVGQLTDAIATGDLTVPAEIDAWNSPFLTPALREQAKRYLVGRNSFEEQQDKEQNGVRNAVELRQRVAGYDPSQDPDRQQYFELVREIGTRVEQSMAGEITGELYKKYGTQPPKLKVRPEIEQNVSKSLDTIFDPKQGAIPWRKEVPVFDPKGRPVKDFNGNPKTELKEDLAAKQRAIDAQTAIELKMADWFKENPEATLPEVKKKLNEVLPEGTRAGALEALQKKMKPQTAVTGELNDDLIATVKGFETFIPKAYGDYKQTSVGYGTRAKSRDEVLSEPQADARLREELSMHAGRVDAAARKTGIALTQGQRNALISFDFNTGQGAYLIESSGGNVSEVKRRLQLYTKAGGKDLPGLVNRRKKEADIFDS